MLVWVLITKRTVESLVVSIMLAAILVYRGDFFSSFTDAFMDTMESPDNVFTVLVMALMGGMVNLIVCTGGVTAFEKAAYKLGKSKRSIYLTSLGIMAATSIDDGLNMLCASYAAYTPAKEKGIVREKLALFFSMLPTVLSSFFPLSLWGIFVIGTLSATVKEGTVGVFVRSIPFNFFSILTLIAMVFFSFNLLPKSKQLKGAEKRYEEEGTLWPAGSEKFLSVHDTEIIPVFDIGPSETVGLLSYRIDDDVTVNGEHGGAVAFKFTGAIKSASVTVGVKLAHQRTRVENATIITS